MPPPAHLSQVPALEAFGSHPRLESSTLRPPAATLIRLARRQAAGAGDLVRQRIGLQTLRRMLHAANRQEGRNNGWSGCGMTRLCAAAFLSLITCVYPRLPTCRCSRSSLPPSAAAAASTAPTRHSW